MGPIHYDAQDALQILLKNEPAVEEELREDELHDVLAVLEEALHAIPDAVNEEEDDNSDLAEEPI